MAATDRPDYSVKGIPLRGRGAAVAAASLYNYYST